MQPEIFTHKFASGRIGCIGVRYKGAEALVVCGMPFPLTDEEHAEYEKLRVIVADHVEENEQILRNNGFEGGGE